MWLKIEHTDADIYFVLLLLLLLSSLQDWLLDMMAKENLAIHRPIQYKYL